MVACHNPDSRCALTGCEHAEKLDHLPVEIQSDQTLALPIESGNCFGVIHDAGFQGQRGIRCEATCQRPERAHEQRLEADCSEQGNAKLDYSGDVLLQQQSGRAEAHEQAEPDAGREEESPARARARGMLMAAMTMVGWVLAVAGGGWSVPVTEAKQRHRRQPGGAEGECECVGVHEDADPLDKTVTRNLQPQLALHEACLKSFVTMQIRLPDEFGG